MSQQLVTTTDNKKSKKLIGSQSITGSSILYAPASPTYRAKRKPATASKRPKGGWRRTASLEFSEVRLIHEGAQSLKKAGYNFNTFITVSPPFELTDDSDCKRFCYSRSKFLGQYFKRRGLKYCALRVFEKALGGKLHLHMLVSVPKANLADVLSKGDGSVVDIRRAEKCHLAYITKNRRPLPPEIEKTLNHRRKKGEAFRGKRWSFTKDAIEIIKWSEQHG
jgi:hypothetical protein